MTMCDRIGVMSGGRVERSGTPLELYDRPRDLFVATVIGSPAMNLLEGEIVAGEQGPQLPLQVGIGLRLPAAAAGAGTVVCGIRPEHIVLDPEGLAAEAVVLEPRS